MPVQTDKRETIGFYPLSTYIKLTMHQRSHVHEYFSNSEPVPKSFPNFKWPHRLDFNLFKAQYNMLQYKI